MGIYSYLMSLWEQISTVFWWGSSSPPDQTKPTESSDKLHQIPSHFPNSLTDPNEIAKVEKIYLNVRCDGKITEVGIFPQEKISVLLKEICDMAGKKPERMTLVYEGEHLDVNERVCHYSRLRGGTIVNLIHV